jgi:hypothetical protein
MIGEVGVRIPAIVVEEQHDVARAGIDSGVTPGRDTDVLR